MAHYRGSYLWITEIYLAFKLVIATDCQFPTFVRCDSLCSIAAYNLAAPATGIVWAVGLNGFPAPNGLFMLAVEY